MVQASRLRPRGLGVLGVVVAAVALLLGWTSTAGPGTAQAADVRPAVAAVGGAPAGWGLNSFGQVGDGSTTSRSRPVWVDRLGTLAGWTITAVAAGMGHSCAITSEGAAVCWGRNDSGQLGIGSNVNRSYPQLVSTSGVLLGKKVVGLAAGVAHTCALTSDGVVACWGQNSSGELGDGTTTTRPRPVGLDQSGVLAGKKVVALASGGGYHTCALTLAGDVACWGYNMYGELGDGQNGGWATRPVLVDRSGVLTGKTIAQVSVGRFHTCARATDNTLACWGQGDNGQIGNGSQKDQTRPALVDRAGALAGKNLTGLVSGDFHTCALADDNSIACWGMGSAGQLGDGSAAMKSVPILVDGTGVLAGWKITQIAAGGYHSCALAGDGAVACWGDNADGQLGNGNTTRQLRPVLVVNNGAFAQSRVIGIEAGGWHTLAVAVTVPDAPTGVAVARGNGSLSVSFTAPAFNGGSAITNYRYSTDNGATWVARAPASTMSPLVISGLTNGTTYQVRLRAVNAQGDGAVSAAVPGTPSTVPAAPTDLVAVPGVDRLTIHFTAPASDGGAAITNYLYSTNFGSTWLVRSPASAASPLVITGLTNGVAYGVKLRAVNAAGEGAPSVAVIGKPAALPDAPTNLSAVAGDGVATVSFVAPAFNGGASITTYQYSTDGGTTWIPRWPSSTVSPLVITGLTNGTTYQVRLRAVNISGPGAASGPVAVTPLDAASLVFVPVPPARVAETRVSFGGAGALAALETREMSVLFAGAQQVVPSRAAAVAYNLTVPNPSARGHVRVEPGNAAVLTSASAANFLAGQTIANGLTAKLSPTGTLKVYNGSTGPAEVVLDVVGYYLPGTAATQAQKAAGRFTPVAPVRAYSSDTGGGPTPSQATTTVDLSSVLPVGTSAVAYNITVVNPSQPGHLRVFPAGTPRPGASTINFITGDRVANGTSVPVSGDRGIAVFNGSGGPVTFLLDVVGYYSGSGGFFHAVDPVRTMSTRASEGGAGPIPAGGQRVVEVWHAQSAPQVEVVPSGALAIDYNVTAVATGSVGHLRVWPDGQKLPGASTLNWPAAGYTRANGSVVGLPVNRRVAVYNGATTPTDVLIDVNGYYLPAGS